jgi:hypothetical protein
MLRYSPHMLELDLVFAEIFLLSAESIHSRRNKRLLSLLLLILLLIWSTKPRLLMLISEVCSSIALTLISLLIFVHAGELHREFQKTSAEITNSALNRTEKRLLFRTISNNKNTLNT